MQADKAEDLGGGRYFGVLEGLHERILEYNNHKNNK
jgi:hypothetical protein